MECLRNRVLMEVPDPTRNGRRSMRSEAVRLARSWQRALGKTEPITAWQAAKRMIKKKGSALYLPAFKSLAQEPLTQDDGRVKLFLKAEKWRLPPGERLKTARAIQYRGPRYNIMLAKYLAPLEDRLYEHMASSWNPEGIYTSKGLTPNARARQVRRLFQRHRQGAALCLDHSRFDAHVSPVALRTEHLIYRMLCGGNTRVLAWLLKMQLVNRGTAAHGTKYKVKGCRMSGDVNTALGNTIINAFVLAAACLGEPVDILVEGDDGVIFGPRDVLERIQLWLGARVEEMGFELKQKLVYCIEDIDYCSGGVLPVGRSDALAVREWPKPLELDSYTARRVDPSSAGEKAYSQAVGYWHLYQGLPVYQAWSEYLLSHVEPVQYDAWYDREFHLRMASTLREDAPCGLTSEARDAFGIWSGLPPSDQLSLEKSLFEARGPHPVSPSAQAVAALKRDRSLWR